MLLIPLVKISSLVPGAELKAQTHLRAFNQVMILSTLNRSWCVVMETSYRVLVVIDHPFRFIKQPTKTFQDYNRNMLAAWHHKLSIAFQIMQEPLSQTLLFCKNSNWENPVMVFLLLQILLIQMALWRQKSQKEEISSRPRVWAWKLSLHSQIRCLLTSDLWC